MISPLRRRPARATRSLGIMALLIPWIPAKLEADQLQWQIEAYGGNYYGSDRSALYGAYTRPLGNDWSMTLEALYENVDDYRFQGIGGHLLWQVSEDIRMGVVGSTGAEIFPVETYLGDTLISSGKARYSLSSAGVETEMNTESLTLALQAGHIFRNENDRPDRDYTSVDAFYWGTDYHWYLRAADQRSGGDALTFGEAYRRWQASPVPTTFYLGASTGQYESVYAGAYLELATDRHSSWTVDLGAGRTEGEWQLQLELYILLGPGADAPYISAFGFSVGD